MTGTTIMARRDKSGRRVLCGRQDATGRYVCGESLLMPGGGMLRGDWRQGADGVWAMTGSAQARRQRSHVIASGNMRQSPDDAAFERARLAHGDAGGNRRRPEEGPNAHRAAVAQPAMLLRCPKCGGVNSLKDAMVGAEALRAGRLAAPHRSE